MTTGTLPTNAPLTTTVETMPPVPAWTASSSPAPRKATPGPSFRRVVGSEWLKVTSVPSSWIIATTMIALSTAAGASLAYSESSDPAGAATDMAATTARTLAPLGLVGQLFVVLLAVLVVANEFSTGQVRATYTAVPKRLPILAARAAVAAVAVAVISVVSSIGAWAASSVVLSTVGVHTSLVDPQVLETVGANTAYLMLLAVFGVGLATIVKNAAAALSAAFGVLFVLPIAAALVLTTTSIDMSTLMLSYADTIMSNLLSGSEAWGELPRDLGTIAAWIGVPFLIAAGITRHRDV